MTGFRSLLISGDSKIFGLQEYGVQVLDSKGESLGSFDLYDDSISNVGQYLALGGNGLLIASFRAEAAIGMQR